MAGGKLSNFSTSRSWLAKTEKTSAMECLAVDGCGKKRMSSVISRTLSASICSMPYLMRVDHGSVFGSSKRSKVVSGIEHFW